MDPKLPCWGSTSGPSILNINRVGIKSHQQAVEENHSLMCANMLSQAHAGDPSWVWTEAKVDEAVDRVNKESSSKQHMIGGWKRRAVKNLLLHLKGSCAAMLQESYLVWTWDKGWMSEKTLRMGCWKVNHKFQSSTPWQPVYTTTQSCCERVIKTLCSNWNDTERAQSRDAIESARPCNQMSSDPDFKDCSLTTMTWLRALYYENWLLPTAKSLFGDAAVLTLETAWNRGHVDWHAALDSGIKLRNQGCSYTSVNLKNFEYIHNLLTVESDSDARAPTVQRSVGVDMGKFNQFRSDYADDARNFASLCAGVEKEGGEHLLFDLKEARRVAKAGAACVETFEKSYLAVASDLTHGPAGMITHYNVFIRQVEKDTGLMDNQIPKMCIWDLNGIPNEAARDRKTMQSLTGIFHSILKADGDRTMGVVLHRRTSPGRGLTKKGYQRMMSELMEVSGLNVDLDLALNFHSTTAARLKTSLVVTGDLVFIDGARGDNVFMQSNLLKGSLTNLAMPAYADMHVGCVRTGDGLSTQARLHYIPACAFENILVDGFTGVAASGREGGGQPVAVACVFEPFSEAVLDSMTSLQTKKNKIGIDIRGVCLMSVNDAAAFKQHISDSVLDLWLREAIDVAGHPRQHAVKFQTRCGRKKQTNAITTELVHVGIAGVIAGASVGIAGARSRPSGGFASGVASRQSTGSFYSPKKRNNYQSSSEGHLCKFLSGGGVSELCLKVSSVNKAGKLVPKKDIMGEFLDILETQAAAGEFYDEVNRTMPTAPTLPEHGSSTFNEMPEPVNNSPACGEKKYATLEALEAETWTTEAHSPDGKIVFLRNSAGEGWAKIVSDCERVGGDKALSWGSGQKVDQDQVQAKKDNGHTALPVILGDDKAQVFYKVPLCISF